VSGGLDVTLSETRNGFIKSAASHGWDLNHVEIFELTPPDGTLDPDQQQTLLYSSDLALDETIKEMNAVPLCSKACRKGAKGDGAGLLYRGIALSPLGAAGRSASRAVVDLSPRADIDADQSSARRSCLVCASTGGRRHEGNDLTIGNV
jgi:hypothetical protein